eukprot:ctg_628.g154
MSRALLGSRLARALSASLTRPTIVSHRVNAAPASALRASLQRSTATAAAAAPEAEAATQDTVNLNFYCPHVIVAHQRPVQSVTVPAASGLMGILPNHVPTVAQMRPGVVSIVGAEGEKEERYFVSSGFTFVHPDRTDICAVEAVRLEDIDEEAVARALAECESQVAAVSGNSPAEQERAAVAQIGVDVYLAMQGALATSR